VSCGGPEAQTIGAFFAAVQSGDDQARAAVSNVGFPGEADSWGMGELVNESTESFKFPELRQKVRQAQSELEFFNQKWGNFLSDNERLHEQYQARIKQDPDYEFKGDLAEFKEEMDALLEEEKRLQKHVEDTSRQMETERNSAGVSLMGSTVTGDFEGEVAVKEYLVRVTSGSGEKLYKFTLSKYNLVNKSNQSKPRSRWAITKIEEQG
jgi:hypothetical protein